MTACSGCARGVAIALAAWLLAALRAARRRRRSALLDVSARPAERALLAGLKAYDDAQYDSADRLFREALAAGLASPRDRAEAHKRLAFIHCASRPPRRLRGRVQARAPGRPHFALDKSEAGHPVWGPVYKKLQP